MNKTLKIYIGVHKIMNVCINIQAKHCMKSLTYIVRKNAQESIPYIVQESMPRKMLDINRIRCIIRL